MRIKYENFMVVWSGSLLLVCFILLGIAACNNSTTQAPLYFAKTIESTAKPVRDSIKITDGTTGRVLVVTVRDTYKKSVTVSYDSVVFVTSYVPSATPVDTIVASPVEPGTYGTLVYSNGFNSQKDLDPFGHGQIGNGSLSTTIKTEGNGSFKSVPANVSSGIRSEVQLEGAQTPQEGTLDYWAYYETIFSGSGHSLQAHPGTPGGSSSPGLWHENGKFVISNWKSGTNTKYPTGYTIERSKWLHIVLQYRFGSNGYLILSVNDKTLLDKSGIQVGDGSSMYWKIGVNLWENQSSVVYYDNLKIWKR